MAPKERWNDEEKQHMADFRKFCKDKGVRVPDDDIEVFRFLQVKKWDIKGTYDMLVAKAQLLAQTLPWTINESSLQILRNGFFYLSGRDRQLRPIVVVRPISLFNMKPLPSGDDAIGAMLVMLHYVTTHMCRDGVVENVINVVDMTGIGVFNMQYRLMK